MKIALVHELLHKLGGAERVVKVFADLFPDAPIYTLLYDEQKTGAVFPKERVKTSFLQKYFKIIRKPQPLLPWMPRAIEYFDFSGFDLVLSSSSAFAHGIITPLHTKHICYCHAPMRYAWDYTHEYNKEKTEGILSGCKSYLLSKLLYNVRQWDRVAADRPDIYIANSKEVQRRLKKYYDQDSELLYPPVRIERFHARKSSGDYFLVVSALTAFKKIDLAIKACNKLHQKLYIIGFGEQKKNLQSIAGPDIKFLGRLNDKETASYMENALALIFPGADDFGIVPVEAMAAGTPVLAYKKGGVLETVKEGETGEFFEEQNIDSIIYCIKKFLSKKEQYSQERLRNRAETFSEEKFKENIIQICRSCKKF